ncbi:MAG: HMA2 domain-containing protein [Cyanobacteria bacterium P01_A01_bin.83]
MIATTSTNNLSNLPTEDATAQIGAFLREHGEIETITPVAIAILVTNQFKLRGANALLVNLLVASITRQIFAKLKQEAPQKEIQSNDSASTIEEMSASEPDLQGYAIAHAIPGRVRLKMPQLSLDNDFAQRLQTALNADEYVNQVRINRAAASIAINYDNQGLSDWELGLRLMGIINTVGQDNQVNS